MERLESGQFEEEIINTTAVTEAVVASLLFVYDSDTHLSKDNLITVIRQTPEIDSTEAKALVATLFDKDSALLRHPRDPETGGEDTSRIEFNVQGYWLINDAFTHDAMSYDEIDNMLLAQQALERRNFFKHYQSKQGEV